jgi:hypothetical protein
MPFGRSSARLFAALGGGTILKIGAPQSPFGGGLGWFWDGERVYPAGPPGFGRAGGGERIGGKAGQAPNSGTSAARRGGSSPLLAPGTLSAKFADVRKTNKT